MVTTKTVLGRVQYNNGDFAEIETYGIDGIETGLILETIQIDCPETENGAEEFRRTFGVGTLVDITTTVVTTISAKTARDLDELDRACEEVQRQFDSGKI